MLLFHVLKQRPVRVLFICLGNSYRSKMAETFANAYGSDILEANSAGFMPAKQPSLTARRLMLEKGLDIPESAPRRWHQNDLETSDLIINMCEYGLPKTSAPVVKTPFPDPVGRAEDERREIRDQIEILVQVLLAQFRQARDEWPWNLQFQPEEQTTASWWPPHPASVQSPHAGLPA
jgi:arsenate reductase